MVGEQQVRFDEFIDQQHLSARAVDQFPGFAVDVALPVDWAPVDTFDASAGARVWLWRSDPRGSVFCASAVLVLEQVETALDPTMVFALLCAQQRQSVPNAGELHRDLAVAAEGPGFAGTLALQIDHEVGAIGSTTHARVLTTDQQTLIAQLTVTALHDSPVDHGAIRLSVRVDNGPAVADTVRYHGGDPTAAPGSGR